MPKKSDINLSFIDSIRDNPKGYRYLHTQDFIRTLGERNWHFSLKEANEWIERYQPDFCDKTPDFSENRYWILRNMGRVF